MKDALEAHRDALDDTLCHFLCALRTSQSRTTKAGLLKVAALSEPTNLLGPWVLSFLRNKECNVDETVKKIERRRDEFEEKDFLDAARNITPTMRLLLAGGIVQYVGEDKDGFPTIYIVTARDKPIASEREDRKRNLDLWLSYVTRWTPTNPSCRVTWIINQAGASLTANTDLTFQREVMTRLAKYFPFVQHRVYLCNMSTAISFVLKPLLRHAPAAIRESMVVVSEREVKSGVLLQHFDAQVLPVALGGDNDCDREENWEKFALDVIDYAAVMSEKLQRSNVGFQSSSGDSSTNSLNMEDAPLVSLFPRMKLLEMQMSRPSAVADEVFVQVVDRHRVRVVVENEERSPEASGIASPLSASVRRLSSYQLASPRRSSMFAEELRTFQPRTQPSRQLQSQTTAGWKQSLIASVELHHATTDFIQVERLSELEASLPALLQLLQNEPALFPEHVAMIGNCLTRCRAVALQLLQGVLPATARTKDNEGTDGGRDGPEAEEEEDGLWFQFDFESWLLRFASKGSLLYGQRVSNPQTIDTSNRSLFLESLSQSLSLAIESMEATREGEHVLQQHVLPRLLSMWSPLVPHAAWKASLEEKQRYAWSALAAALVRLEDHLAAWEALHRFSPSNPRTGEVECGFQNLDLLRCMEDCKQRARRCRHEWFLGLLPPWPNEEALRVPQVTLDLGYDVLWREPTEEHSPKGSGLMSSSLWTGLWQQKQQTHRRPFPASQWSSHPFRYCPLAWSMPACRNWLELLIRLETLEQKRVDVMKQIGALRMQWNLSTVATAESTTSSASSPSIEVPLTSALPLSVMRGNERGKLQRMLELVENRSSEFLFCLQVKVIADATIDGAPLSWHQLLDWAGKLPSSTTPEDGMSIAGKGLAEALDSLDDACAKTDYSNPKLLNFTSPAERLAALRLVVPLLELSLAPARFETKGQVPAPRAVVDPLGLVRYVTDLVAAMARDA